MAPDDAPLRADIRRLGELLGQTLVRQQGQELLDLVEQVRRSARTDRAQTAAILSAVDLPTAIELARAFSAYFHLANVAEQVHRGRDLAAGRSDPLARAAARIGAALENDEVTLEQVRDGVARVAARPVFTAHPTEAARRSVLLKLRGLADAIAASPTAPALDDPATERRAAELVELLWQTEPVEVVLRAARLVHHLRALQAPRNSFAPAVGVAAERALAAWTSGTSIATRATLPAGPVVPEPALSRPVRVGTPVTCRSAVVGAASLHYQWRRGQRVVGHHAAYVPKVRDLRHRLRCTVTATNTLASLIRPSAAHRVGRGRFALLQDPQVTGTPRVGRALRVTAGRWSPRPGDLTYRWRRGHTVLSRARHYTPVGADHGRRLSVTVTATKHAYRHAATTLRTPRIH